MTHKLYVVQRVSWRMRGWREETWDRGEAPAHVGVPLAGFSECEKAEALRDRLTAEARRDLNPFRFGEVGRLTKVTEHQFRDEVGRIGIRPPRLEKVPNSDYQERNWVKWWDVNVGNMTDEQRERVWAMLDRLQLFHVVVMELEA